MDGVCKAHGDRLSLFSLLMLATATCLLGCPSTEPAADASSVDDAVADTAPSDATDEATDAKSDDGSAGDAASDADGGSDVAETDAGTVDELDRSVAWVKLLDSSGMDEITDVEVDQNGFIYVSGWVSGDVGDATFNGGPSDAFLAKYNPDGTREWLKLFGEGEEDKLVSLELAPFAGVVGLGNAHIGDNRTVLHIVEVNRENGEVKSDTSHRIDKANTHVIGKDLVALNGNRMVVTGTAEAAEFGDDVGDGMDAFVAEFHRQEGRQWMKFRGTDGRDVGVGATHWSKNTGAVWLSAHDVDGSSGSTLELFGVSESGDVSELGTVAETSFDARHLWSFGAERGPDESLIHASLPPSNGDALASDAFVAGYDAEGTGQFETSFGGDDVDLAADNSLGDDSIWVTGVDDFTFEDGQPAARGYLARLGRDGRREAMKTFGKDGDVLPHAIDRDADPEQALYVGGTTYGSIDDQSPGDENQSAAFLARFE